MSFDRVIANVVREYATFTLKDTPEESEDRQVNYCHYARVFEQWAINLLQEYVQREPDSIRLAQAKVRLIDRYFEWRTSVPKGHRNRTSDSGHVCIFHVFEQTYQKIKMAELILAPPAFVVPPSPAPLALPQVSGIYLGEIVGEEN